MFTALRRLATPSRDPGLPSFLTVREGDLVHRGPRVRLRWLRRVVVLAAAAALGPSVALAGLSSSARADVGAHVVCRWTDQRLSEVSGIALSGVHLGVAWVHNDSGGGPYLYAMDTTTCVVRARVRISNIGARDIEGIASGVDGTGRHVLWVGDVGDNRDSWPSVRIHAVVEPAVLKNESVTARTYQFTYRDGPHNAETVLAVPTKPQLWVVTKQLAEGGIYPLPVPLLSHTVMQLSRIAPAGGLITDGAISPDGRKYVLRDYLWAYVFDGLPPGRQITRITLPQQPQGEAITWTADGQGLLTAGERDNSLWFVPIPTDLPASSSPPTSPSAIVTPTPNGSSVGGGIGKPFAVAVATIAALAVVGLATRRLRR